MFRWTRSYPLLLVWFLVVIQVCSVSVAAAGAGRSRTWQGRGRDPTLTSPFTPTLISQTHKPIAVQIDGHLVNSQKGSTVVDSCSPRFTWQLASISGENDVTQRSYQIRVSSAYSPDRSQERLDSGVVISSQTRDVHLEGIERLLKPNTLYQYSIRYWTSKPSEWHRGTFRTTLLLHGECTLLSAPKHAFHLHGLRSPAKARSLPGADWIGCKRGLAGQFRMDFSLTADASSIQTAVAYLATAGYSELYLDGQEVDPTRKLDPAWTEYNSIALYVSHDITNLLQSSQKNTAAATTNHTLGVWIGSGWYSEEMQNAKLYPTYGPPRFQLLLTVTMNDGSTQNFTSGDDNSWHGRSSPILHDSVFHGELYDARREDSQWSIPLTPGESLDRNWGPVDILPSPLTDTGELQYQTQAPIRIVQRFTPVWVHEVGMQIWIIDCGQNFAGWVRMNVTNYPPGVQLRIRYSELLNGTHGDTISTSNLEGAAQTDIYITRGPQSDAAVWDESYEPRFTVHGFRYVEIVGIWPTDDDMRNTTVECVVVHSELSSGGSLSLPNPVQQQIQTLMIWASTSNLMSLPSDCPQRNERKGWTGDVALSIDQMMFNFNGLQEFWHKYLRDMRQTQQLNSNGAIADTAPFTAGNVVADPNWGSAYPTTCWALYSHLNDTDTLKEHYPNLVSWVQFLNQSVTESGIANMYFYYGDWYPPNFMDISCNQSLVSAYAFMHDVALLSNIATVLGQHSDANMYSYLYDELASQFHQAFYNATVNGYGYGEQACNIVALSLDGVVPADLRAAVLQSLVSSINEAGGHALVGIVANALLYPLLSSNGQHDLATDLTTSVTYPSYGYMFTNPNVNATTLWERWDSDTHSWGNANSHNHHMFSSVGSWFWRYVVGVQIGGDEMPARPQSGGLFAPASRSKLGLRNGTRNEPVISIAPRLPKCVHTNSMQSNSACQLSANLHTRFGQLQVSWRCVNFSSSSSEDHEAHCRTLQLALHIPPNSKAKIDFPNMPSVNEWGYRIDQVQPRHIQQVEVAASRTSTRTTARRKRIRHPEIGTSNSELIGFTIGSGVHEWKIGYTEDD